MPVKKGINNFLKDKTKKVNFIKERIDIHLNNLRKTKASFENRSQLAEYLRLRLTEDRVADWEKSERQTLKPKLMAKSTLYRNKEYLAKLDSFLASLRPEQGIDTRLAKTSLPMAQAKITEQQAEISNLKNKISILERYIENSGFEKNHEPNPKFIADKSEPLIDFVQTARALSLLIEATEGQFVIDDGDLKATHKMINNIVADKRTMSAFNKWINDQSAGND